MASPQALGGALTYNPLLTGDANAKLFALQRQAALAAALQQEGLTPLDTKDRQIGGVGYAISPMEGLNKLAQALTGGLETQKAAEDYGNIYSGGSSSNGNGQSGIGGLYSDLGQRLQSGDPQASQQYGAFLLGNPDTARAGAELITNAMKPTLAGPTAYNTKLGEAAAGNAPAGQMPSGMAPPIAASQLNAPPNVSSGAPLPPPSADIPTQPDIPPSTGGIQLNAPAPPVSLMPAPLPGESNNQYQARLKAAEAGASAKATEQGKNEGEADLNSAQISSRIDNALKNVDEMINQVPNTSTGIPLVSHELQQDILRRTKPNMAAANTRFEQLNNQLYVQELGPLIKQLGSRGNQFVENAVKQGSAVDINGNDPEKLQALQGIREYLSNIQQNAQNQQGILSGQQPPKQSPYQGARQAPDGNFYIPDPSRPGKYLMVK